MNKKEAIEKVKAMTVETFFSGTLFVKQQEVIAIIEQIGEPTSGCAEETPRYLRNVLARLRELPEHDREVWLKGIMSEFEQDFSHAKWREGYEQGKFDGAVEAEKSNKVVIPQFVAKWIDYCKFTHVDLQHALVVGDVYFYNYANQKDFSKLKEFLETENNQELFARAWLDGYDVEQEKLYTVEIPDPNADGYSIVLGRKEGKVCIRQFVSPTWQMNCSNQLTEAEIKQDFDWAWQWAKPCDKRAKEVQDDTEI